MRCESPGMSIVMTGSIAFGFTDNGDWIEIRVGAHCGGRFTGTSYSPSS